MTPTSGELALLVGTLVSVATAIFGAACASLAWKWFLSKTGLRLVSGLLAVFGLAAVYIGSAIALVYVAERLANPPIAGLREFGIGYHFIHPGFQPKSSVEARGRRSE